MQYITSTYIKLFKSMENFMSKSVITFCEKSLYFLINTTGLLSNKISISRKEKRLIIP